MRRLVELYGLLFLLIGITPTNANLTPQTNANIADYLLTFCNDPAANGGNGFDAGSTNFANCARVTYDSTYEENLTPYVKINDGATWDCSFVAWDVFYCDKCSPGFVINPTSTDNVYALDRCVAEGSALAAGSTLREDIVPAVNRFKARPDLFSKTKSPLLHVTVIPEDPDFSGTPGTVPPPQPTVGKYSTELAVPDGGTLCGLTVPHCRALTVHWSKLGCQLNDPCSTCDFRQKNPWVGWNNGGSSDGRAPGDWDQDTNAVPNPAFFWQVDQFNETRVGWDNTDAQGRGENGRRWDWNPSWGAHEDGPTLGASELDTLGDLLECKNCEPNFFSWQVPHGLPPTQWASFEFRGDLSLAVNNKPIEGGDTYFTANPWWMRTVCRSCESIDYYGNKAFDEAEDDAPSCNVTFKDRLQTNNRMQCARQCSRFTSPLGQKLEFYVEPFGQPSGSVTSKLPIFCEDWDKNCLRCNISASVSADPEFNSTNVGENGDHGLMCTKCRPGTVPALRAQVTEVKWNKYVKKGKTLSATGYNLGCVKEDVVPMYGSVEPVLEYCARGLTKEQQELARKMKAGTSSIAADISTNNASSVSFAWSVASTESVVVQPAQTPLPADLVENAKAKGGSNQPDSWTFADFLPESFFDFMPKYKDPLLDPACKKTKACKKVLDRIKAFGLPVPDQCCPAKNWPVPVLVNEKGLDTTTKWQLKSLRELAVDPYKEKAAKLSVRGYGGQQYFLKREQVCCVVVASSPLFPRTNTHRGAVHTLTHVYAYTDQPFLFFFPFRHPC
jgi:hypothetical protein